MSSGPLYVQAFTESAVTSCSLWSWLSARGVLIRDPSAFSFAYSVAHGLLTNLMRGLVRYRLQQTLFASTTREAIGRVSEDRLTVIR